MIVLFLYSVLFWNISGEPFAGDRFRNKAQGFVWDRVFGLFGELIIDAGKSLLKITFWNRERGTEP